MITNHFAILVYISIVACTVKQFKNEKGDTE